jgi:hypothetical protein
MLERRYGISYQYLKETPGNPGGVRVNPYRIVGTNYLPPRIFYSLDKGLEYIIKEGYKYALHLHRDSIILNESFILERLEELRTGKYFFAGDLAYDEEFESAKNQILPPGFHFNPENLMFDLSGQLIGFEKFFEMFEDRDFHSHNWGAIESLIGNWFHYCLSLRSVTKYNDSIYPLYKKLILVREARGHHGYYKNCGLLNLP